MQHNHIYFVAAVLKRFYDQAVIIIPEEFLISSPLPPCTSHLPRLKPTSSPGTHLKTPPPPHLFCCLSGTKGPPWHPPFNSDTAMTDACSMSIIIISSGYWQIGQIQTKFHKSIHLSSSSTKPPLLLIALCWNPFSESIRLACVLVSLNASFTSETVEELPTKPRLAG